MGLQCATPSLSSSARITDISISVLYVCTNQYLLGHVVPNTGAAGAGGNVSGYRFEPLADTPAGRAVIEFGGGAGKGFYHAEHDRYLMWMMSSAGWGFSTAREITVDELIPLLISFAARGYAAMRQSPQANLTAAPQSLAARRHSLTFRSCFTVARRWQHKQVRGDHE